MRLGGRDGHVPNKTCPICSAPAEKLAALGDAHRYECPRHHRFKVADSVFAIEADRTEEDWERALQVAKRRVSKPDEWPTIRTDDF